MSLNLSNYNIVIIIIIFIIIILILFKINSEKLTNTLTNENFETTSITTSPKEYYSLNLSGSTLDSLYNQTNDFKNQLDSNNWDRVNKLDPTITPSMPVFIERKSGSIILDWTNNKNYISGLTPTKLYKLDVFVALYNINMQQDKGPWTLVVRKTVNGSSYTEFPTPLIVNGYMPGDFYQITLPVSAFITDCSAFSVFIKSDIKMDIRAVSQKTEGGIAAANTLLTISLLEI
jgi:hypothetical protein